MARAAFMRSSPENHAYPGSMSALACTQQLTFPFNAACWPVISGHLSMQNMEIGLPAMPQIRALHGRDWPGSGNLAIETLG